MIYEGAGIFCCSHSFYVYHHYFSSFVVLPTHPRQKTKPTRAKPNPSVIRAKMNILSRDSYLKLPLSTESAVAAHSLLDRIFVNVTDQHYLVLSLPTAACSCLSATPSQVKDNGTDPS